MSLSVIDYGAKGDGKTDDSNAFKAALDASWHGGVVHVPAGTYIAHNIVLGSKRRLVGEGMGITTIKAPQDSKSRMISIPKWASRSGCVGITFDYSEGAHPTVHYDPQTRPKYAGAVTLMIQGAYCHVRECEVIRSALDAIVFGAAARDGWACENHVDGADRGGIVAAGSEAEPTQNMLLYANHVENTYASGIMANGAISRSMFSNNIVNNTGGSGDAIAAYSPRNNQLSVVGNQGNKLGNNGMHIGGNHILVSANSINGAAEHGYLIQSKDRVPSVGAVIVGNYARNYGRTGLTIGGYTDFQDVGNQTHHEAQS